MNEFWEKVEHYNVKLIPYALIVLLVIIIIELFAEVENLQIILIIHLADYLVLAVFIVDLIFLALKSKNARFFFKHYWLDLLAVIPLGLAFTLINRVYEVIAEIERIVVSQAILHETVEAEKIVSKETKVVQEAKLIVKSSRLAKILRICSVGLKGILKTRLFSKFTRKTSHAQKTEKKAKKKEIK